MLDGREAAGAPRPEKRAAVASGGSRDLPQRLPAGWTTVAFGEIVKRAQYGLSTATDPSGTMPIVGMKNMDGGVVSLEELALVQVDAAERKNFRLMPGDILLNRTNSPDLVGKVAIWESDMEATFASYIVRFQLDTTRADPRYVNIVLNTHGSQSRIRQLSTRAVSQANINPTVFREHVELVLPPISAQRQIVGIVADWDRSIASVEATLRAKKNQKRSAMRELLHGDELVRLGDVFVEREERGLDLPLAGITASGGVVPRTAIDRRDTSAEDKSKYKVIRPGDIGYNTMRMWQGVSGLSNLTGLISPAYTVVTPLSDRIDPLYAAQLFKLPRMVHRFWRHSQGLVDDTLQLRFQHFAEIVVGVPSVRAQQAIGALLSTMDEEIDLLGRQADLLRTQRRGLVKTLLSGQWVAASAKVEAA